MFKAVTASVLLCAAFSFYAQTAQLPPLIAPEQIVLPPLAGAIRSMDRPGAALYDDWVYVNPAGGATPLYEAVLTERATGKRVHYANQQQMVDIDKRSSDGAYLTRMQLDARPMWAPALPTCCGLSITRASLCRGNSFKALTSVSAGAAVPRLRD